MPPQEMKPGKCIPASPFHRNSLTYPSENRINNSVPCHGDSLHLPRFCYGEDCAPEVQSVCHRGCPCTANGLHWQVCDTSETNARNKRPGQNPETGRPETKRQRQSRNRDLDRICRCFFGSGRNKCCGIWQLQYKAGIGAEYKPGSRSRLPCT